MKLILRRTRFCRYGVSGQILINHIEVADTLEHPTQFLPQGTYPIVIRHHPKLHRKAPYLVTNPETLKLLETGDCAELVEVKLPFLGIGNGPFNNVDGSILVGKLHPEIRGLILHSADTFARLIDRLDKAQKRGESIELIIP